MVLNFSDGMSIDTTGPLRPLHLDDGWYVVGKGMLIPVDSREEALEEIDVLNGNGGSNSEA